MDWLPEHKDSIQTNIMAVKAEERANKIIVELRGEGMTYGEILSVIRSALSRLDGLRKVKKTK